MVKTRHILRLGELTFVSVYLEKILVSWTSCEWAQMILLSSNPIPLFDAKSDTIAI